MTVYSSHFRRFWWGYRSTNRKRWTQS